MYLAFSIASRTPNDLNAPQPAPHISITRKECAKMAGHDPDSRCISMAAQVSHARLPIITVFVFVFVFAGPSGRVEICDVPTSDYVRPARSTEMHLVHSSEAALSTRIPTKDPRSSRSSSSLSPSGCRPLASGRLGNDISCEGAKASVERCTGESIVALVGLDVLDVSERLASLLSQSRI